MEEGIVEEILKAKRIVVLTGSGISAESGIPTFRGRGGLWEKYNPSVYANIPGLSLALFTKPEKVVGFVTEISKTIMGASPNPGHLALVELEKRGKLKAIITQNIDNLHQRAGSKNVIELHGNLYRWQCLKCRKEQIFSQERLNSFLNVLSQVRSSRLGIMKSFRKFSQCSCKGRIRPSIVFFGETLPANQFLKAEKAISNCDLLLLVGTSGIVQPAASLPSLAKGAETRIIEINPERTELSYLCDDTILGTASKILPKLLVS